VRIDNGRFERLPYEHEQFDVIVLFNVVENIPNQDEFFRAVNARLKPGGHFILNYVEMRHNLIAALQGSKYFLYRPPICYSYTGPVMKRLLNQYGFEIAAKFSRHPLPARGENLHAAGLAERVAACEMAATRATRIPHLRLSVTHRRRPKGRGRFSRCCHGKQRYAIEGGVLSALLIAATIMRTTRIGRGFWEDEAVEYVLGAARPFWGSFTYQPFPLYHVFAHIALYFSDAEWVIRIPSLARGIAGIGVLYVVTRRYFGVTAAIVAAISLTVSTFHISSSTEARFYALTMLASVLVLWTLHTALLRNTRRDWIAYVIAGNVAAMSQLMMLPLLGSMAGAAVVWTAIENRRSGAPLLTPRMRNLLIASALTLAGVLVAVLSSGYNLARFVATDSTNEVETVILDDLGNPIESIQTRRLAPSQYWFYLRFYLEEPTGVPAALLAAFA
jgi:hypothetical protein